MPNPFERFGVTDADIAKAIAESAEVDAGLNRFMEDEVVPYWREQTPVDEGRTAASVKVVQKAKGGKGVVAMTDWKAHLIEYGTGAPGPTKAAAPGEKTAVHFGGTLGEGITEGGDE